MHDSGGQTERGGFTCKMPAGELRALNADGPFALDPNTAKERIDCPKVLAPEFHRTATPRFATLGEIVCAGSGETQRCSGVYWCVMGVAWATIFELLSDEDASVPLPWSFRD